jgi:hypothetical protein
MKTIAASNATDARPRSAMIESRLSSEVPALVKLAYRRLHQRSRRWEHIQMPLMQSMERMADRLMRLATLRCAA